MGFTSHLHLVALWFFCLLFHTQAVDMACYYLSLTAETACTILLYSLVVKVYGRTLPAFVAGLSFAASMFECAEVTTGKEAPAGHPVYIAWPLGLEDFASGDFTLVR
jgi:hypothetical protein